MKRTLDVLDASALGPLLGFGARRILVTVRARFAVTTPGGDPVLAVAGALRLSQRTEAPPGVHMRRPRADLVLLAFKRPDGRGVALAVQETRDGTIVLSHADELQGGAALLDPVEEVTLPAPEPRQ